jgi:hypothetical protein
MTTPENDPGTHAQDTPVPPEATPQPVPPAAPPRYGQYAPGYGPQQPPTPPSDPPQYGQPQYGAPQYGAPGYGPPRYGAPGYGPPVAPPLAPRPGIIPLRPLSLGDLYDGAFRAIRQNPKVMLIFPALLSVVTAVLSEVLTLAVGSQLSWLSDDLDMLSSGVTDPSFEGPSASSVAGLGLLAVVVLVVTVLVTLVIQGLVIANIGQAVLGRTPTPRAVWASVRGRTLGGLVVISLFGALVPVVSLVVLVALVALVAQASTGAAVALGVVGGLALAVAWVWFVVKLLLAAPVLVLERSTVRASIARAWRLTRGSFWRVLGIGLLTAILAGILSGLLRVPATVFDAVVGFSAGGSDSLSGGSLVASAVVSVVFAVIATTVTTAFTGGVTALLYIDLRMRREGLDVSLTAAAASE